MKILGLTTNIEELLKAIDKRFPYRFKVSPCLESYSEVFSFFLRATVRAMVCLPSRVWHTGIHPIKPLRPWILRVPATNPMWLEIHHRSIQ
jgi:hypothetical protein